MKVLIVKMTSMGDVIHLFPAITDAVKAIPNIEFHWVIDPAFAELPLWHRSVAKIIPLPLRRWRKKPLQAIKKELPEAIKNLRTHSYDLIIDAQGLLKSAMVARLARGPRAGLTLKTAREKSAALFYQHRHAVDFHQHAVVRMRELFAKALNYDMPQTVPDYGLKFTIDPELQKDAYVIFFHGTTWINKHWPEAFWLALLDKVVASGVRVLLPWGNVKEKLRAEQLASQHALAKVLPKSGLTELANLIISARAIVAVDTGLAHLAAALNVPTISLYGPTNPALTGAMGQHQIHLTADLTCTPCLHRKCHYKGISEYKPACMDAITPSRVWQQLTLLIGRV